MRARMHLCKFVSTHMCIFVHACKYTCVFVYMRIYIHIMHAFIHRGTGWQLWPKPCMLNTCWDVERGRKLESPRMRASEGVHRHANTRVHLHWFCMCTQIMRCNKEIHGRFAENLWSNLCTCIHTCMYVHMYAYIYVSLHLRTYDLYIFQCVCVCMHLCVYAWSLCRMYIYIYICIHIYIVHTLTTWSSTVKWWHDHQLWNDDMVINCEMMTWSSTVKWWHDHQLWNDDMIINCEMMTWSSTVKWWHDHDVHPERCSTSEGCKVCATAVTDGWTTCIMHACTCANVHEACMHMR
jgi:hypothetical protein